MSWYGAHATRSKAEVRRLLPPAACKRCVYWFRCVIGSLPDVWHRPHPNCTRCGIPKWDLLRRLTAEDERRRFGQGA